MIGRKLEAVQDRVGRKLLGASNTVRGDSRGFPRFPETGVRAIRGPPKMGPPGPRNARDVGTGGPEIAGVIGTWGA